MARASRMSSQFKIRPATENDAEAMTEVFFKSFNARFFQYLWPDVPEKRQWFDEVWKIGLNNPTDRTFLVEDMQNGNKVVAFSRWQIPNNEGNLERLWPEVNEKLFDMEVAGAFFGGMEANRHTLMGDRPHWFLELLGTHEDYQRHGIGGALLRWGTDQADREGVETYLDASEIGLPYYIKHHKFTGPGMPFKNAVPDRPAYGSFSAKSVVRPIQPLANGV